MSDIISNNLSGLNSLYKDNTTYSSKTSSLENTLNNSDLSTADSDKLMSVCKDFEEYFVEQMVKSMVKMASVDGSSDADDYSSLFGLSSDSDDSYLSSMSSYYGGQMVTKLTESLCDDTNGNGIGLAKTLYEQMKRNYNIQDADDKSSSVK
jgi:peptidoglycan hydrolase FlgJ